MPRYEFGKVETRRLKKFKDPETGKTRQVTRTFYQTLSPFNTNPAGEVKQAPQIWSEINIEAERWVQSDSVEKWGKF